MGLDLHSVWDSRLIAKSLRTIPKNYTYPSDIRRIENALRGTIYDPYIRQIMLEGVLGRFESEIDEWLTCPPAEESSPRPYPPSEKFQQLPLGSLKSTTRVTISGRRRTPPPDLPPTDDGIVCPYAWAAPMHELNCEIIWPLALDENYTSTVDSTNSYLELDTPEYVGAIKDAWLVEKLLAMGGIRLAATLNYLFALEGDDVGPLYFAD